MAASPEALRAPFSMVKAEPRDPDSASKETMAAPARLGRVKKMARLMGIFFIFLIHTRAWNNHLQKSQGAPAMKT
jgi:hypothetical protein